MGRDGPCNIKQRLIFGECKKHYHGSSQITFWIMVLIGVIIALAWGPVSEGNAEYAKEMKSIENMDCQSLREYLATTDSYKGSIKAEKMFKWLCVDTRSMEFGQ